MKRRGFLFLRTLMMAAAILASAAAPWLASTAHADTPPPTAVIYWTMDNRFPSTKKADGTIYMPMTTAYANPGVFNVTFSACASHGGTGDYIVSYTWKIEGANIATTTATVTTCNAKYVPVSKLPEGNYRVTLTVLSGSSQTTTVYKDIAVKDYLVVAIGDSFSSGEGNPDIRGDYGGWFGETPARWLDGTCHRSSLAGPFQAAKKLEDSSVTTSVTFLFVSCTGATINSGLLGTYKGLDAQLKQVHDILGGRTIDALIVSIGGNDIGFGDIGSECVREAGCWNSTGPNHDLAPLSQRIPAMLEHLTVLYQQLNDAIHQQLSVANIYITEYPNPTHNDAGVVCSTMVNDIAAWHEISHDEAAWLESVAFRPLNQRVSTAAATWGWRYVGGMASVFEGVPGHGYCATDTNRWIRTATESAKYQGPSDKQLTTGTLHPTERGHAQYRDVIYANVTQYLR